MMWRQEKLTLEPRERGFHLITNEVKRALDISDLSIGMVHIFIQHTSASLTLNENASSEVRRDFERYFNHVVPDGAKYFEHRMEGPDDMPAHIKASTLGSSLSLPITNGSLNLGTWQGIYLCEHRDRGGRRTLLLTAWGESR